MSKTIDGVNPVQEDIFFTGNAKQGYFYTSTDDQGNGDWANPNVVLGGVGTLIQSQQRAEEGKVLCCIQVVMVANDGGKFQLVSLGDSNTVEIFETGADVLADNPSRVLQLDKGDFITSTTEGFTLSQGNVLRSRYGMSGLTSTIDNQFGQPIQILSSGLYSKKFLYYALRQSENTDSGNIGYIYVATSTLSGNVSLSNGDGSIIYETKYLTPYEVYVFETQGNQEYLITSDTNIYCCATSNTNRNDTRIIYPPDNIIVGHGRFAYVSAIYANTEVNWYRQDGTSGSFEVSPGSPYGFGLIGFPLGYGEGGFVIFKANGPIASFSSNDGDGSDATSFVPVKYFGNVIGLPNYIDTDHICVITLKPAIGKIYNSDGTIQTGYFKTERVGNDGPCVYRSVGNLNPGYIEMNEKGYVICDVSGTSNVVKSNGNEITLLGVVNDALLNSPFIRRSWIRMVTPLDTAYSAGEIPINSIFLSNDLGDISIGPSGTDFIINVDGLYLVNTCASFSTDNEERLLNFELKRSTDIGHSNTVITIYNHRDCIPRLETGTTYRSLSYSHATYLQTGHYYWFEFSSSNSGGVTLLSNTFSTFIQRISGNLF